MALEFVIETDAPELAEALREAYVKGARAEAAKAINKTMTLVRRDVVAYVSGRTGIKQSIINRRVKTYKRGRARSDKLYAVGFLGEFVIPVSQLTPKPRKVGKRRGGGVTYKTVPGQGKVPGAFYAKVPNKTAGSAYVRKPGARYKTSATGKKGAYPIKEISISIRDYLRSGARNVLSSNAPEYFSKLFFEDMSKRANKEFEKRGLSRV